MAYDAISTQSTRSERPSSLGLSWKRQRWRHPESIHLKKSFSKAMIGFSARLFRFSVSGSNFCDSIQLENFFEPVLTALLVFPHLIDMNAYLKACIPAGTCSGNQLYGLAFQYTMYHCGMVGQQLVRKIVLLFIPAPPCTSQA